MSERRPEDERTAGADGHERAERSGSRGDHDGAERTAGAAGAARRCTPPRRPARSQKPVVFAYAGSALGFAAVLGALSLQVASGADPAIGAGQQAAAPPPKRVLVRKIVRRVIVTREARDPEPAAAAPAAVAAPAPGAAASAASAPAPAPAAPAPVPAPAPAPPTTRSS